MWYHVSQVIRECAGTGRQARLRGVCLRRTGSSPVTRTSVGSYKGLEISYNYF